MYSHAESPEYDTIVAELVEFISETFFVDKEDIDVELSLVDTGIIDSFGLLEIVAFIEKTYGVRVSENELNKDNFGSVIRIVDFICGQSP
jgi:acyl carrier protein